MTSPEQVTIRLPSLVRAYVCVFMVVWVGMVSWTTMVRHHGASIIVGALFIAFGCALGYQILRLGVRSDPDGVLHVHNRFSNKQFSRSDIEEFRMGTNGGARLGQRGIQALLRDGTTYRLDVCGASLGIGTRRLDRQLDQLNAWLRTR